MLLAALQMQARPSDVGANLARLERAAAEAALRGASLLVTPELGLVGYGAGPDLPLLAEPADGALAGNVAAIARRTNVQPYLLPCEADKGKAGNPGNWRNSWVNLIKKRRG